MLQVEFMAHVVRPLHMMWHGLWIYETIVPRIVIFFVPQTKSFALLFNQGRQLRLEAITGVITNHNGDSCRAQQRPGMFVVAVCDRFKI